MARPPMPGKKQSRSPTPSPGPESEDEADEASTFKRPTRPPSSGLYQNRAIKVEEQVKVELKMESVADVDSKVENGLQDDISQRSVLRPASQAADERIKGAEGPLRCKDEPFWTSSVAGPSVDVDMKTSSQPPTPADHLVPPSMPPPSTSSSTPSGSHSHEPSPSPAAENGSPTKASKLKKPKPGKYEPQLIGHLPIAREAAMATFTEIPDNRYQYGTLGRSREALESMTCDCTYEHGVDDPENACGPHSDCINRLTQVECLPDDCRCGAYCRNQRLQKKEYGPLEIVQTEMKGFGLRAARSIPKDGFIYEYVGDVISQSSFKKRMRDYAEEGIRHFYFMMLQKDEFIDATKRGGIGRFANHSCKPNCYVAKWTVGEFVRMGIFASRDIRQYEELTFNYNVDRYGHDPQPCYCGEPNCVGFLGGKTQTDIATMDDLYLDALGITDESDLMELKGTKKKKGKKIDDPDFMPIVRPIVDKDVPKIIAALRQASSRKVLIKIMTRIKLTEDPSPLRQLMRLRGFSAMTNILGDHGQDSEMVITVMETVKTWPLVAQNKVQDSKILDCVKKLTGSEDERVKTLALKLVEQWEALPTNYRIPKRQLGEGSEDWLQNVIDGKSGARQPPLFHRERLSLDQLPSPKEKSPEPELKPQPKPTAEPELNLSKSAVKSVLARIKATNEARELAEKEEKEQQARQAAAEQFRKEADEKRRQRRKAESAKRKGVDKAQKQELLEQKAANKEKRLLKLVGAVVIGAMSKYSKQLGHDAFKEEAKKLTQTIADKEKARPAYAESKLESLSPEKTEKIKEFAIQHMKKVMHRKKKEARAGQSHSSSSTAYSQAGSSTAAATPNAKDTEDAIMSEMGVDGVDMMDVDSHEQAAEDMGDDDDDTIHADEHGGSAVAEDDTTMCSPIDNTVDPSGFASDPRKRPPSEDVLLEPGPIGLC